MKIYSFSKTIKLQVGEVKPGLFMINLTLLLKSLRVEILSLTQLHVWNS